ncbi:MAG: acylphosphatase [Candidatus Diapherotrites archaeon]|nr:acylphosphatase [Candidatus Diapherotrites archaeon]
MQNKRLHATVAGHVQGVFFRAHCQKEAAKLGLTGFCRNLADGRVEVVAEGPKEKLEVLENWLASGSPHSAVEKVESEWLEATGEFPAFEIKY